MRKWFLSSLLLMTGAVYLGYGVRINKSSSLPQTLFFAKPLLEISKGKTVSISHPAFSVSVAKIISGSPGDIIQVKERRIFVDGIDYGEIKLISDSGREYTPISGGEIPQGYFFVSTPDLNSFDSRYAEFGLIKEEWIREELCPIY